MSALGGSEAVSVNQWPWWTRLQQQGAPQQSHVQHRPGDQRQYVRPAPRFASDRERLHLQPGLQAAPSEKPGLPAVEEFEGAKLRWESGSRSPRGGQGQVVVECLRLQQLRQQRPRGKETVTLLDGFDDECVMLLDGDDDDDDDGDDGE